MGVLGTTLLSLAMVLGISHAIYVYRQQISSLRSNASNSLIGTHLRAFYWAFWALLLWLLSGSYVIALWSVALIPYLLARAAGKTVDSRVMTAAR